VKQLIDAGADVNTIDEGATLLLEAADLGCKDAVICLVKSAAAVDVIAKCHNSYTPLHFAALWGDTRAAKCILDMIASVYAKSEHGMQPLHLAS
jgi:ankyrin repeat protein